MDIKYEHDVTATGRSNRNTKPYDLVPSGDYTTEKDINDIKNINV